MMRFIFFTFHIAIAVLFSSALMAENSDFIVLNYDVISEEEDVGDMTFKFSQGESGYVIVEHSNIKASSWWWSIDVTTIASEEYRYDAGLVKVDSKTVDKDDGIAYWVKIKSHEDGFWGDFTVIERITAGESKQFSGLTFAVAGRTSNNIEEILSLSSKIFADRKEKAEGAKFPKNSFDTTFNHLPFFIQKNAGKPLPKKINILDTDNLEVSPVEINDLGEKTILVGTSKIKVRHLTLSDGEFDPSHLWIKVDDTSLPYLVRHVGVDEDGAFELKLKP